MMSLRVCLKIGVAILLLEFAGCQSRSEHATETSGEAHYILIAALEAWKDGKPNSLADRKPAIRFVDEDQKSGLQLVDYEFENEGAEIRPFQNVPINLMLKDPQGQLIDKAVTYQVTVEPGRSVLRSDQ
jgi:hypothetical protein